MKRVCHLSQSYYTLRKQTVSIIFTPKKTNKKKQIRFVCHFKAGGGVPHDVREEERRRARPETSFQTQAIKHLTVVCQRIPNMTHAVRGRCCLTLL